MPALLTYAKMTSEDHRALRQALDDALASGSVVLTTGAQPAEQQQGWTSSTFSSRAALGIRRSANSRGKDRARSMAPTVDSPAVRGDAHLVDARMSGERRQADNRQVDLQATARDKRAPLLQAQAWARSVLRRLNLKTCSNYPVLKRSFTDIPASSQAGQISDATF